MRKQTKAICSSWAFLAVSLIALIIPNSAFADPRAEQVTAALLFNFPRYVQWPTNFQVTDDNALVFGVIGAPDVAKELQQIVAARTIGGRKAIIKNFASTDDLEPVHVLFVGTLRPEAIRAIVAHYNEQPTLTVSNAEGSLTMGGIIEFVRRGTRIRFDLNLRRAEQSNLEVSSGLIDLADSVER